MSMNNAGKQMNSDLASTAKIETLVKNAKSIGDIASETQYKKQGLAAVVRYYKSMNTVNEIAKKYGEVMEMIQEYKGDAKDKRASGIKLLGRLNVNIIQ